MPKFSIIVPVYKVENYIRQCIESILNQTYKDFEVLVVDDCGGDNSIKIVKEFANSDDRIKILYHTHNRGLAAARNTALENAAGKYIVCLDSDDWMEPNCLDILNAEFTIRKTNSIWFNSKKYFEKSQTFQNEPMYNQCDGYRTLTPDNIAAFADFTWIKAYTRDSIQKYHICWPEGLTFEDGEFYFEYFTMNPKTYVISDCLINYRHRAGSIVREAERGNVKLNDVFEVLRHLREFWVKQGVYEEYKRTMIKLIQNRTRMCLSHNYSKENRQLTYQFLKDINYPNDFHFQSYECKKETPLVSVIIPVHNVELYISECLKSIINQTYMNLEIICIDDCSQDNSIKIVEDYAKNDARIKIIRHEISKGAGGARNTGIEKSSGKYIHFVDSDDYLEPDCISTTVSILEEYNLNVVFFKADTFFQKEQIRKPIWYKAYRDWEDGRFNIDENNICDIPCHCWNKAYKRSFMVENNIRMPEKILYQDVEFSFRIFTKSHETYMIDKPLYVYRIREQSSISNVYSHAAKAEDLYIAHERVYDYLVKNNLMEQYKNAYLQLVMLCLNNYRSNNLLQKKCLPRMLQFLKYINFPEKYQDLINQNK